MDGLLNTVENIENEEEFSLKKLFVPLTTAKAITWIVVVGLVVYINSLLNGFVLDDFGQIINNQSVHSLFGIIQIWLNNIQAQQVSDYYRPLPYTFYTLIYVNFQQTSFFYHITQLLFHIGNTILIYLIFKKYLKAGVAFFISLLFLIHPINEETVVYIANLQDTLFVFFGLSALYLLQKKSDELKYLIFADVLLLLSLFSKETGILFLIITVLYVYLFKKKMLVKFSITTFITGVVYLSIRLITHVPFHKEALTMIMTQSFGERMVNVPAIIYYYLVTFISPINLVVYHTWVIRNIQLNNFYFPLLIDAIFLIVLILTCIYISRNKNSKVLIFFISWFLLGLIAHLQIFPIDMTVADHYFYFPVIGFLAIIGLFLSTINLKKLNKYVVIFIASIILLIFSLRTIVRNTNWENQSVLLSHDEKTENNDYLLELLYSTDLIQNNNTTEALPHIQRAISLNPQSGVAWDSLGVIYYKENKYTLAKQTYLHAIAIDNYYGAYENLALLMLQHDSLFESSKFIKKATHIYPNSEKLWYYRIIASYKLKDYNDALYAAQQYFNLKQDQQSYEIILYLKNKQPINIDL